MGQEQSGELEPSVLQEISEGRKSQFANQNQFHTVREEKARRPSVRKKDKRESLGGINGNPHE